MVNERSSDARSPEQPQQSTDVIGAEVTSSSLEKKAADPTVTSSSLATPTTANTLATAKADGGGEGSPHASSDPHVAHDGSVGRPVLWSEIPPEVHAKIERNRRAALERRAKYLRTLESERDIAREFGEEIKERFVGLPGLTDSSASTTTAASSSSSSGSDVSAIIEKNAKLINKAMEAVEPLPKNTWTKFYDYDLSKMKDTRGGFIQELDSPDAAEKAAEAADEEANRKRKWQPNVVQERPSIFMGAEDNYECQDCTSIDIDFQLLTHFHVPVCIGCRDTQPEKYSLLTKTECRQDYLLTDPELRDTELFPFWERPNPKKSTWNNMMLYLRCQVEDFAFKKWGGSEGLDQEFERREKDKEMRKEIKFKKELRDLRNKTRTSVWQDKKMKQRSKTHKHDFGTALIDPTTGASVQTCVECGIQVECEEF